MHTSDTVQRVRIYLSESNEAGGRPRYLAAMELLRESGATGATALRGIAGFGVSQQLRVALSDTERSLPIIIEWIDRAERVARILPALDTLLPDALITVEAVQVYRATLRSSGPFGERSVGELALRDVAVISRQEGFVAAVRALVESNQTFIPVLDEQRRLVGSIGDIHLRRQHLPGQHMLAAKPSAERDVLLARYDTMSLDETMSSDILALAADSSMLQAAKAMVEWGLDDVPVIARDGTFYGIFGIDQALHAAQEARAPAQGAIRDADMPVPLGVLMQGVFQTVLGYASAAEGVERLLAAGESPLVVTDNGRPLGLLDHAHLLTQSEDQLRAQLAAVQPITSRAGLQEILGDIRVASLPLVPLPTLPTSATYDQAIGVLREQQVPWIAAVDEQGKLQGLVGRRTLLRALVQESAA